MARRVKTKTRRRTARRTPARARTRRGASTKDAGAAFQQLVDIMAHLRSPQGCPWDREQTIASLRGFVLEETHEVLDAIDRDDVVALRGEIGDLIFEGVFLAQICKDAGQFTIEDSLRAISAKLIRRHPHIFDPAGRPLKTPTEVVQQWEQIKAEEQTAAGQRRSLLGGLAKSLPSLLRAHEIGMRVAAVGFDWPAATDVMDKIEEEIAELRRALASEGTARSEEEMGDLLFSIANLARKLGIEPESALRKANEKFTKRFDALEERVHADGRSVRELTLEQLEAEWTRVKEIAKHGEDGVNGTGFTGEREKREIN
jgi:nucleoside triphosphate diphosphatase